ncbi:MAG: hypothetical protein D6705_17010 [Deltaproteobacteria bacterium]|nr:MAG: hypothetical protein D6705_17010 [Deltaproteobacteria bacterium]
MLVGCGDLGERHVAEGVPHLERLVLRNLSIDNDDLSAIGALAALRHVEFDRVRTQGDISTSVATTAPVRSLVLRDLPPRSLLVDLVATWSKSLTSLSLEGQWADSRTLLATKRAMGLERLEVLGTRAGNYGLHALAAHDALREIRLSGSGFTDATPLYLRNLPIERFECECPRLGDVGVGHLRFLDRLTHVALVEPAASPAGLARLGRVSSLRSIVLDGVELDDGTIAAWGALPDLTSLRIDSGRVALTTLAPLAGARKLETLVLRATDLGDTTVATLPAFANLTRLDLSNTSVGDRSLPAIARSGPLEDLDLSGTRVTRRLEPLAALRTLRSLRLAETDVVDDGIRAIGPLPHLEHLDLRATLVSDAVLDALATFGHLRTVDLRDTSVDPERARRILGARGIEVRTGPSVDTRGH